MLNVHTIYLFTKLFYLFIKKSDKSIHTYKKWASTNFKKETLLNNTQIFPGKKNALFAQKGFGYLVLQLFYL